MLHIFMLNQDKSLVTLATKKFPKIFLKLHAFVTTCGKLWVNCGKLENLWGIFAESLVENYGK